MNPEPSARALSRFKFVLASRAFFVAALFVLVVLAYTPAWDLPLFQDDIDHFNWIGGNDIARLWSSSPFGYYRPLTQTVWKLSEWVAGRFDAGMLHWINLLLHTVNAALVGFLAEAWLPQRAQRWGRWLAAILLALFPFAFQVVLFVGALFHLLVTMLILGTLLGHHAYRARGNRAGLGIALVCSLLAPFAHETGLAAGMLLAASEVLWMRMQGRRPSWPLLIWAIATPAFGFVIWSTVAKAGPQTAQPDLNGIMVNLSYALQGLTYPVGTIEKSILNAGSVSDLVVLWVGAVLLLIPMSVIAWRAGYLRVFASGLVLWAIVSLPFALTLVPAYVLAAPRLLYVTSIGVALVWTAALLGLRDTIMIERWPRIRRVLAFVVLFALVVVSMAFIRARIPFYTLLGDALWALGDVIDGEHSALVVNFPRLARAHDRVFPLGSESALFFARHAGLREGLAMNGIDAPDEVQTITFGYLVPELPYSLETMGRAADWPDVAAAIAGVDLVYRSYPADDAIAIRYVGRQMEPSSVTPLINFDQAVKLIDARLSMSEDNLLVLTLQWQYFGGADSAAVFVHILNASGELIAQSDGAAMDMLPFWQWPNGKQVEEVRYIALDDVLVNINIGLFDTLNGERLAPQDIHGRGYADGSVPLFEVDLLSGVIRALIER